MTLSERIWQRHRAVSPPSDAPTSGYRMTRTLRASTLARTCKTYARTLLAWPLTASWISMLYKEFSSTPIERFRWPWSSTNSSRNAVKYAFSNRSDGHIWVRLVRQDENTALISVRDDGVGLPAGLTSARAGDWECGSSRHFRKQLGAAISHRGDVDGTEFVLMVPLQRVTESIRDSLRCTEFGAGTKLPTWDVPPNYRCRG